MVDLAEDLECLCQIMRTCGKVLDKPKAKVTFYVLLLSSASSEPSVF